MNSDCYELIVITPPKFNSSLLKNDGWKTTFLLGLENFRVYDVKLPGGTATATTTTGGQVAQSR